jgi:hypothetical protein
MSWQGAGGLLPAFDKYDEAACPESTRQAKKCEQPGDKGRPRRSGR